MVVWYEMKCLSSHIHTYSPDDLFTNQPPSMKRMNSGTWLMKGEEVIENGESLITYAKYNLKELAVSVPVIRAG